MIGIAAIMLLAFLLVSCGSSDPQIEIRLAVASNFKAPAAEIVREFEKRTGRLVTVSLGSTGKHYAQISNGAPFDLFLAGDSERPERLEGEGIAVEGTRFTYATGKLVLWSADPGFVDDEGKVLESGEFSKIAIANPELAPYGRAAEEVLRKRGLWDRLANAVVRGENIGQTYQFVASGNAEMGFVSYSQIIGSDGDPEGSFWEVPRELYTPIEQQTVLLKETPGGREFLEFLASSDAKKIIRKYGYSTE